LKQERYRHHRMKIKELAVQRHKRIKKNMTSFTFRLSLVLILTSGTRLF
jgi:hypothetical protein